MSTGPVCVCVRRISFRAIRKFGSFFAFTAVLLLAFSFVAHAQGGVPLQTVVTDQSQLNLSPDFGIPAATAIDQKGDFAFIGEGDSALFVRASGASSVTRLLQNGDAVPGISGSTITGFVQSIFESQAGVLFAVDYSLADGAPHQAILVWSSGTNYTTIATDTTTAPGTNGLTYGFDSLPRGINDSGDVAFSSAPTDGEVALFIEPSGGSAIRIVGTGDSISNPTSGTITVSGLTVTPGLNALGEILFEVVPGNGYYVATKTGAITAVAYPSLAQGAVAGGCAPGTVTSASDVTLNNSGVIAFFDVSSGGSGICYTTIGGTPSAAVLEGQAAPQSLNGTIQNFVANQFVFNDSGDVVFDAALNGSSAPLTALLRFNASTTQLETVAYEGQSDPSGTGETFLFLGPLSEASDGTATFIAVLSDGRTEGLYQGSGTGSPIVLAGAEYSSSLPENGLLDLTQTSAQTLNDHSVIFSANFDLGSAYFAELLSSPGSPPTLQSLVSTGDALPSGARVQFDPSVSAAGNYLGFAAQNAGGRESLFVSNISTGTNSNIVTEGDFDLGGIMTSFQATDSLAPAGEAPLITPPAIYVNSSGEAVFDASIVGTPFSTAILLASSTGSISEVVSVADQIQPAGFSVEALLPVWEALNPINDSGQVTFIAQSPTVGYAVFRYNSDGTTTEIAATGDTATNGDPLSIIAGAFMPTIAMNQSGVVTFESSYPPNKGGLYEGDGTAPPQPVALNGGPISGGTDTQNSVQELGGISDSGSVAFFGLVNQGFPTGYFVGLALPANIPATIAQNGGPAPGGGLFRLVRVLPSGGLVVYPDMVQMNGEGDILFYSPLLGANADSGYFISRGTGPNAGVLQSLALQGQSVSGVGTLDTLPFPGEPDQGFALGPDGELLFSDSFTNGNTTASGLFLARQDGSLTKVLAAGDEVPGGGTATNIQIAPGLAGGAPGTFAFWASISGGSAHQAIFATQIPSGTAASTTALTSSLTPSPLNQSVTLTATVTSTTQGTPTGTVTFFDGGVALGAPVALTSATATFATSSLAAGSHSITAQYSGDTTFAPSTSTAFTQVVEGTADFSVSASPSSLSIVAGQSGQVTITVTPVNGSTQTVSFSCSGLPAMTTCQANPSSITLDGTHQASSVITIQTTASSAVPPGIIADRNGPPTFVAAQWLEIVVGLLALLGAIPFFARRRFAGVALCAAIAAVCLIAGCGGGNGGSNPGGSSGTPAGTYSITLTIASGASSHTASTSITVTK
jgi:hypothetical protein